MLRYRGASIIDQDRENKLKLYLLGLLTEGEEEQLELRLLTEPEYAEEFDIVVNELIDQYVADDFEGKDLQRMEEHFFASTARQEKLRFALALKKRKLDRGSDTSVLHQLPPRSALPRYLAIAASLIAIAGLGFGVWRLFVYQQDLERGLVALHSAFREERPIEARLADFSYAPVANQRGGSARVDYVQRDLAASLLLKEVAEHRTAAALHALGQYYLAGREFDKAVDQFKAALALEPQNSKIHSDLGAALMERGKLLLRDSKQGKGIEEFAEGLAHLTKALELVNPPLEALFNRALIYEQIALPAKAEEDWRRYLQLDPNSKWTVEARQNLERVESQKKRTSQSKEEIFQRFLQAFQSGNDEESWQVVSSYQNRSGNLVVEELLDAYLDASSEGRADDARRNLQMFSRVGEIAKQRAHDHFFFDLAAFYEATTPTQRALLTRARALMKEGYGGWGRLAVDANLSLFTQAKKLFDEAGDHNESQIAQYWQSFCHFRRHDKKQTDEILRPLLIAFETGKHLWLQVRCLYLLSAIEFDSNEHSKALGFAQRSLEIAERTNDAVGFLNVTGALIEYFRYLGNYPKALSFIERSIPLLSAVSLDPIQGSRHYGFAATAFATVGLFAAADGYQREAMRLATKTGATAAMTYSYAFLGSINGKMGNFGEALRNARLAFELAGANSKEGADKNVLAYSSLQMGDIFREMGDFHEAVASFTRAISLYEELNHSTYLYQAHKGRLLSYIALKNDELVKDEIAITLGIVEKYRDQIREENNRNTFFDVEQSVYDIAIDFEFSRLNNQQIAFDHLELSRSRSLLDLLQADAQAPIRTQEPDIVFQKISQPLTLSQIRREMPAQTEILRYAVLEDRLLIWVISRDAESVVSREVSRTELGEKVSRYIEIISKPNDDENQEELQLAKDLFSILIAPVEPLLKKERQLCIISDGILDYLPFGSLVSPDSGRYLIEDHTFIRSPSPTVYLISTQTATARAGRKNERLLSVGNPRFDRAAYPHLPDLSSARNEAIRVAAYYEGSSPLIEGAASPARVKAEMSRADVVHLALHSAIDQDVSLRSKLLLAKAAVGGDSKSSESVLYAREIYEYKLPQTRLVVLSACQTGAERQYAGEGTTSLARAFIAAGVPLVIASLWPVDSSATEQLMVDFHRQRRQEGIPTAEALRKAQIAMLHDPAARFRRPYYWAAFSVFGGYAQF